MSNRLPLLDLTKESDFLKTIPQNIFTNIYQTGLSGCGLLHTSCFAGEHSEHSFQQHGIVVHLKPEQNSLRRLGNLEVKENVNVGDMAIVPTDVRHWQKTQAEISEKILVTIEPQVISNIAQEAIAEQIELLPTFAKSDPLIYHLAVNLKANLDSNSYDRLYTESLFSLLSAHLLRHYTTRKAALKNYEDGLSAQKLELAKNYINDRLEHPIKLSDIASLLGISQFYFCHLFKKSTGIAPYKYVVQQRVKKGQKLIQQSKLPLVEIAYECGFSSQSQMTQHFRKQVGVTPKVYRNKVASSM